MTDPLPSIPQSVEALSPSLIAFVQRLVQTPSLPGHEQDVQHLVAQQLQELGLEVELVASRLQDLREHPAFCDDGVAFENRLNVIGRWRGSKNRGSSNSLILNGHVDVVSPGNEALWRDSPWSGKIENGRMVGRGACDMKSGLAAAIYAIAALQKLGFQPQRDVLFESVIGEESGGIGTLTTIVKGYTADAAIILEPTGLKLCPVQSGALTFRLTVPGKAAHAAVKQQGVSAIEQFYPILQALNKLEAQRHRGFTHPLYPNPDAVAPISIGTIRGGEWHSSVPDEVVVEGRYGVLPGESVATAKAQFLSAIAAAAKETPWLRDHPPKLEWIEGQFESGETVTDHPIVATLSQCHEKIVGNRVELEGVTYGSDLRLFTNHAGMPAVLYGPGDLREAHAVDESVAIEDMLTCTKVMALMLVRWCG